ncbi:MAG TPA: SiaC family regulatory phosphoprotein [Bacteroidales bacterium]|nr:SiaC family regulatory phosphoprotein [Bacteroidales bacterium]
MNSLRKKIQATKSTPEVALYSNGMIRIKGRSMISNITEFSRQFEAMVGSYLADPAEVTCVDFHLEYLNTNNLKFYVEILKKIETVLLKNKKLIINWYYEEGDEDIIEKGEYIASVLNVQYNFILMAGHDDD